MVECQFVGVCGKGHDQDQESSVFVGRTDGESMEVQGEDEARAGMEKEFLLPLGWMASLGRCT